MIKFSLKTNNLDIANILKNTIIYSLRDIRHFEVNTLNIAHNSIVKGILIKIRKKMRDINMAYLDELKDLDEEHSKFLDKRQETEPLDNLMKEYQTLSPKMKLLLQEQMKYNDSFTIPTLDDDMEIIYNRPDNFIHEKSILEQEITPTIFEAFEEWKISQIRDKKVSASCLKDYVAAWNWLMLFTQPDRKIHEFTTKEFKIIQSTLQKLPLFMMRNPNFRNKSIKEVFEMDLTDIPKLSPVTVNRHCTVYRQVFEHYKYMEVIERNPVDLRMLKQENPKKTLLNDEDIINLFTKMRGQRYKDMLMIGIYTGMRVSEILLLKKKNIEDDFIFIEKGKTKNSTRYIYIHDMIKPIIQKHIDNNPNEYLIFDGDEQKNIKAMNRRLANILKDKNKTFHGTRKRFTSELLKINERRLEFIQKIVGHKLSAENRLTMETYGQEFNISKDIIKSYIEQVDYPFIIELREKGILDDPSWY
jgi:integrase